jgi:site-specific recombinase XerD
MNIQNAIDNCLDDLGLAKSTRLAYRNGMNSFLAYLDTQEIKATDDVGKLTMDHFVYFLSYISRKYAKQSTGVYSAASKNLLDWLVIHKLIHPDYEDTIRLKMASNRSHRRREDKLPRFPNRTDVPKMLETVKLYEEKWPMVKERNIALLEFLASTGCRNSEVTNLNIKDLDMVKRSAIVTGKGSKERRVWFSQSAADALLEYWRVRKSDMPTDPVFCAHDKGSSGRETKRITPTTTRRIVKDIAILAGIDPNKFSPHYFRHAFAIRVLHETNNLAMVQDMLGHADPGATRVYAKIYSEDLEKAHKEIFH